MICPKCLIEFKDIPNFCPQCGFNLILHKHTLEVVVGEKKWQDVKFIILFYCIIFSTLASTNIYPPLENSFLGEQIIEWLGLLLTFTFLFFARVEKKIIISRFNILSSVTVVAIALLLSLFVNSYYHNFLKSIFNINFEELSQESNALVFSVYFLIFYNCIMPAVTEEIAFRLIIFDKFRNVVSLKEAVFLSSILFAIIHVSFYSTPYFLFVGAILCWIRIYTKSLVPCIIFHFLHNLYVTLCETQNL